jgi:hypothetical protein
VRYARSRLWGVAVGVVAVVAFEVAVCRSVLAAVDPAILLWDSGLSSRFTGVTTTHVDAIKSLVVYPNTKYGTSLERDLARLTFFYTRNPPPSPAAVCNGRPALECCISTDGTAYSPTYDCLLKIDWEASSGVGRELTKVAFESYAVNLFAAELARSSSVVSLAAFQSNSFESGYLLYRWRLESVPEATGWELLTRIDSALVNRLASTMQLLLPRIRVAIDSPNLGKDVFSCSASGFQSIAGRLEDVHGADEVTVSTGFDTDIRRPTNDSAMHALSVRLRSTLGATVFDAVPVPSTPVGADNLALINYFGALLQKNAQCYSCFGPEDETRKFAQIRNQLNTPPSSSLFFALLYLQAVWDTEPIGSLKNRL